jgi:uncharacterized protein
MSQNENEFFLREEAEKLHRLHQERLRQDDATQAAADKKAHWMKCPKCGYDLQTVRWRKVDIDKCFRCGVIALDDGELEALAGQEADGSVLRSFTSLFKKS